MKTEMDGSQDSNIQLPEVKIHSKSHEELLNVIDHLRAQGLSQHVSLPQLIVCGDQSSGKSSVLEAVSGIQFPAADETCTRFATELVLRRSPSTSSSVCIVPDPKRTPEEQAKLRKFKIDLLNNDNFGSIIEKAEKLMGIKDSGGKAIGTDRLRIEIIGPAQPHLTLVDLPGLVHASSSTLSKKDVSAIQNLVDEYISNERSIILAVITAKNDFANQAISTYARKHDVDLNRTLGIITKPDDLPDGSTRQKTFRKLVENKSVRLSLGWHILKNREHCQEHFTSAQRDESEDAFFNNTSWQTLDPKLKGIRELRPRLSQVLQGQILTELPNLIQDVQKGLMECEANLARLGEPRASAKEQAVYLHGVSQTFSKLVQMAVSGHYNADYFLNETKSRSNTKKTRALVVNMLDRFAKDLELKGHKYQVIEDAVAISSEATSGERVVNQPQAENSRRQTHPIKVSKSRRLEEVSQLIKENRGTELPCFFKPDIITQLFHDQCKPWQKLVKSCADRIFKGASLSVRMALEATADPTTLNGILRCIINPALEEIRSELVLRVEETIKPHLFGEPQTFNDYFATRIQNLRQEHHAKYLAERLGSFFGTQPMSRDKTFHVAEARNVNTHDLLNVLTTSAAADMDQFACSEALHFMEAYYQVALKFFVDDFSIHAIEHGLMQKLPTIFDPNTVMKLDESAIADIAAETEESQAERVSCNKKREILQEALKTLRRFETFSEGIKQSLDSDVDSDGDEFMF